MRVIVHPREARAQRLGLRRSARWPEVERAHRARQPGCACCAVDAPPGAVQVHHIVPFHFCILLGRPDLELDERNLITLCEREDGRPGQDHHLLVGHLNNFESANLRAREDAAGPYHGMSESQLRTDAVWLRQVSARIRPVEEMSELERKAFREIVDRLFPKR